MVLPLRFGLIRVCVLTFVLAVIPFSNASAESTVAEMIQNDCAEELKNYCTTVTPGRGRYAACLYAHNDKISERCGAAFEVGALQLNIILSTVRYVIESCQDDLDEYCEGVEIGGGRVEQCLVKKKDKLQERCLTALREAQEDLT